MLDATPYDLDTRFGDEPGTSPEEPIAAANADRFTMALSLALASAGFAESTLKTKAAVKLESEGEGFRNTRSDLTRTTSVPGIAPDLFEAKADCPVSRLLAAEVTLLSTLT